VSDRLLWLEEVCPNCRAAPGLWCQTRSYKGKPLSWLHGARGWRQRACPTCKAQARAVQDADRQARQPAAHRSAALRPSRANDRLGSGGSSSTGAPRSRSSASPAAPASPGASLRSRLRAPADVSWRGGAPVRDRCRRARGSDLGPVCAVPRAPAMVGIVVWDVARREVVSSGTRGDQEFNEVLIPRPRERTPSPWRSDTSRDTSRDTSPEAEVAPVPPARVCERCRTGDRPGGPQRGEVLLEGLPAGRVARPAARALGTRRTSSSREMRPLLAADARRAAARGAVLLRALSASRVARAPRPPTMTSNDTSRRPNPSRTSGRRRGHHIPVHGRHAARGDHNVHVHRRRGHQQLVADVTRMLRSEASRAPYGPATSVANGSAAESEK